MDGFLTLMVPYLKSGVRSEYRVQSFIKQKPSVRCDLEIVITPTSQKVEAEMLDEGVRPVVIHG